MKIKTKLATAIMSLVLVFGLLAVGVYALDKAEVNLGGNLTFSASGVYAKVTGVVSGAVEDVQDKTVTFDNGSADAPVNWNEDLSFDGGEEITYTITVENLSDRTIYVSATDTAGIVDNVTKSMANGAFILDGYDTQDIIIKMRVSNINLSLTNARYDYKIELMDESTVPETNPDEYYNGITLSQGVVTSYDYETAEIVIPAYHKEDGIVYAVTTLGEYFIEDDDVAISVMLPQTLTTIEDSAFASARAITQLIIPAYVESIGSISFGDDDRHISSLIVDQNNEYYDSRTNCNAIIETATNTLILGCNNTIIPEDIQTIGEGAFCGCNGLTSITIPDSVTSIGERAFSGCDNFTSITIGNGVEKIGESAFSGCDGLASVTIPDSVTSIGDYAFHSCSSLESIAIPDSVETIGDYAFSGCNGLTSVTIGNGVQKTIGDRAFSFCKNLTSVTIGNSVTSISASAFEGCSGLTSITIPENVQTIGDYAFEDCSSLISVTLGNSVTSIGKAAFSGCDALTDVYYTGSEEQWNAITIGSNNEKLTGATKHFNHVVA